MLPVARSSFHAITGLRFFLAFNITIYHFGRHLFADMPLWIRNVVDGGYAGTGIFFVMSGFVLTYVYTSRKPINPRSFWIARFTRLYPLYIIALAVTAPFLLLRAGFGVIPGEVAMAVGVTAPLMLQAWHPATACVWNCPAWALSAEAFYYAIFPLLALAFYAPGTTLGGRKALIALVALWLLALTPPTIYFMAERMGALGADWSLWLNLLKFNPLSRLPEFLFGTVLARYFLSRQEVGFIGARAGSILSVLAVVIIFATLTISTTIPYPILHNGLLLPVIAVLIFTLAAGYGPIVRFLSLAPFVRLGEASYALFIFHAPIWAWLYRFAGQLGIDTGRGQSLAFTVAYLAIAVAASLVIHRWVEVPLRDRLRNVFERRKTEARPRFTFRPVLLFGLGALALALFNVNLYASLAPATPVMVRAEHGPLIHPAQFAEGIEESGWQPVTGEWSYEAGSLIQHEVEHYDHAILFEGLVEAPYHYRVQMRLLQNPGGGAVFNAPELGSVAGAHMVRYTDDGSGMFWGYYGDDGIFVGQGYAPTFPPEKAIVHVLDLFVGTETYTVRLDGDPLVEDVPLMSRAGHVGLHSSVSVIAFDWAEVLPLAREHRLVFQEPFAQPLEEAGWIPVGGDWVLEDGAIVDRRREGFDHKLVYREVFSAPYGFGVSLRHLEGVGGGLLFNMPEATVRSGAHMVRFSEDGQGVFWGYFDEEGAFVGQGDVAVTPPGDEAQLLEVGVSGETYRILLNGELVIEEVPLVSSEGHIGLTSSETVVAFDNVEVWRD